MEAELRDEAILQGLPESLDPAFGLGGVRGDVADAEVPQDLAELGRMLGALELFLEAPVGIIADKDAEAIAVERHGQAVPLAQLVQQGEIAVEILRGAEVQGQDGARRIVDGAEEQAGRAGAEPVEWAAVDEDEAPHGRTAGAPSAVLPRPARALRRDAQGPAQAADGIAAHGEAIDLPEFLGAVAVIEVAIRGLDQGQHSCPHGGICYSGEAQRPDRPIVNTPIGDRDRSEATLGRPLSCRASPPMKGARSTGAGGIHRPSSHPGSRAH